MLDHNIIVKDLNDLINNEEFILSLRRETLNSTSGMNKELTALKEKKKENGVIDAKAIVAYSFDQIMGWALFSREDSSCCHSYKFYSNQGILFQIYLKPELRKSGIARKIMETAHKMAGGKELCVVPWSDEATAFFRKNSDLKLKSLLYYVSLDL
jgi:GNAT superfamily N-acetyltransferase